MRTYLIIVCLITIIHCSLCTSSIYEWENRNDHWDRSDELIQWLFKKDTDVESDGASIIATASNDIDSALVEESSSPIIKARNVLEKWRDYRNHIDSVSEKYV